MKEKKTQIKSHRLLDNFIARKAQDHEEPVRAGTPRGEPIGFSFRKYSCALLCLKKMQVQEMAKITKVPYRGLRKWRSEDNFKELVDNLRTDFTTDVIIHLVRRGERQAQLASEYFKRSVREIAETPPPELTWNEFEDLKFYDEYLVATIVVVSAEHFKGLRKEVEGYYSLEDSDLDPVKLAIYFQVAEFWEFLRHYPFRKEDGKKYMGVSQSFSQPFYKVILTQLAREWERNRAISEDTLKKNIYMLHYLAKKFTPVDIDF